MDEATEWAFVFEVSNPTGTRYVTVLHSTAPTRRTALRGARAFAEKRGDEGAVTFGGLTKMHTGLINITEPYRRQRS